MGHGSRLLKEGGKQPTRGFDYGLALDIAEHQQWREYLLLLVTSNACVLLLFLRANRLFRDAGLGSDMDRISHPSPQVTYYAALYDCCVAWITDLNCGSSVDADRLCEFSIQAAPAQEQGFLLNVILVDCGYIAGAGIGHSFDFVNC